MVFVSDSKALTDFLQWEGNEEHTREKAVILSGQNLTAGMVLGVNLSATEVGAADGGNTGSGTIGTIAAGPAAKAGVYEAVCVEVVTNGGVFAVFNPLGDRLGSDAIVATAYTNPEIGFTLADGGTDFAIGDKFTITVSAITRKYLRHETTATSGAEYVAGILLYDTDASTADKDGVAIVRGPAIINQDQLTHDANATAAEQEEVLDALRAVSIVPRSGVGSGPDLT